MPRLRLLLLLLLLLLPLTAQAGKEAPPASLREASTFDEVEQFLLYPPDSGIAGVQAGYIRYIAQHRANDVRNFRRQYWLGGPEGSELDLTQRTQPNGEPYLYAAGTMCTRAAYSMALSYLGIDMTPGDMSATTGMRDLTPPYQEISSLYGLELITDKTSSFDEMMANYLADPSYSPVYVYITKPDGQNHAFLAVARMERTTRYVVVDPSARLSRGKGYHIYMIAFNRIRTYLENCTFYQELRGSKVVSMYQWKLPPP